MPESDLIEIASKEAAVVIAGHTVDAAIAILSPTEPQGVGQALVALARSRRPAEVTLRDAAAVSEQLGVAEIEVVRALHQLSRPSRGPFTRQFRDIETGEAVADDLVAERFRQFHVVAENEDLAWMAWAQTVRVVWALRDGNLP